jgi:hypothetical protein
MIAYDLQCANGHLFEGWFEDRKAFIDQRKRGLLSCPICSATEITQLPSRFAIRSSPAATPPPVDSQEKALTEQLAKKFIRFVETHFDDVGCGFAQEALKIHYGVSEPRNIRGVSTQEEEKILQDEGIEYLKLPMPSRPQNDTNV